ncbi:MAG TPA: hypothetical protein P5093_16240 [Ottowia sp.]|nr:hypothetical protein [Ottowia sp.]
MWRISTADPDDVLSDNLYPPIPDAVDSALLSTRPGLADGGPGAQRPLLFVEQHAVLMAVAVALLAALLSVVLAVRQPWLGLTLTMDPLASEPTVLRVASVAPASPAALAGIAPGDQVLAIGGAGGVLRPVSARDVMFSEAALHDYAQWETFFAAQRQLARWQSGVAMQWQMRVATGGQRIATLAPAPIRPVGSLPAAFWLVVLAGALAMVLPAWAVRATGMRAATACLLLSGLGWLVATVGASVISQPVRELAMEPELFAVLSMAKRGGSVLFMLGLVGLMMFYPTRIASWHAMVVATAVAVAWMVAAFAQWLPTPSMGRPLLLAVGMLVWLVLAVRQWQRSAGEARDRAALRWVGLSFLVGAVLFLSVDLVPWFKGRSELLPPAWTFVLCSLLFASVVLAVRRYRLFDYDVWSRHLLISLLTVITLVGLDLLLLNLLPLNNWQGLGISLAIGAGLYLPLRQWMWNRWFGRSQPNLRNATAVLLTIGMVPSSDRLALWRRLLVELFNTGRFEVMDGTDPPTPEAASHVVLLGDGAAMWLPETGDLPAVVLQRRDQGRRLFTSTDRRMAERLCVLIGQLIQSGEAYRRGVSEERERIADDLHDDLGATLLAVVHVASQPGGSPAVAAAARQALDEMRSAVRNMKARPAPVEEMVADWRSDTVSRLNGAGIEADWDAQVSRPEALVPPRTVHQLTRVLREAISNVMRHSGASRCAVHVNVGQGDIQLEVEDNGVGIDWNSDATRRGQGLANIERRVRRLGGMHRFMQGPMGGTLLMVRVPFEAFSSVPGDIVKDITK